MVLERSGVVLEGPGWSGKVREVVFEILNCLKNPGRSVIIQDEAKIRDDL